MVGRETSRANGWKWWVLGVAWRVRGVAWWASHVCCIAGESLSHNSELSLILWGQLRRLLGFSNLWNDLFGSTRPSFWLPTSPCCRSCGPSGIQLGTEHGKNEREGGSLTLWAEVCLSSVEYFTPSGHD